MKYKEFTLAEAYKLVVPEIAKHWLVREARAVKVYGEDRYRNSNEVPINVCIAEDAMDLAKKLVVEYTKAMEYDSER